MTIEIPPKAMPKKSFVTVGVVFGGYVFKTFTFQDDKITGNAPKVIVSKGATLSYSDGLRIDSGLQEDLNPEIGILTVEVLSKGKLELYKYGFSWETATTAYFDKAQKK